MDMRSHISLKEVVTQPVTDRLSRPLRELRVSVIDRCNFRCTYCMPPDSLHGRGVFLPLVKLLTDHEIADLVRAFTALGVRKLRLTGGEPLVRPGLPALVAMLSQIDGLRDIALTTNGVLLPRLAKDLADAGLTRLTVSLDSLDPEVLRTMSGGKGKLDDVLGGIDAAVAAGFRKLKINTVVQRGVNDHTVLDLLAHFRGTGHTVRLIEYMDVGTCNHWQLDQVVPSAEWVRRINERWPIEPVTDGRPSETARRYRYRDGQGEIGFISSISEPFCGGCTRARLTADGMFYTCLFASRGTNLMPLVRHSERTGDLSERIRAVWEQRGDRYSEIRGEQMPAREKVEMYRIGG
jgi:cyclic pyranopterin phosphate synthase